MRLTHTVRHTHTHWALSRSLSRSLSLLLSLSAPPPFSLPPLSLIHTGLATEAITHRLIRAPTYTPFDSHTNINILQLTLFPPPNLNTPPTLTRQPQAEAEVSAGQLLNKRLERQVGAVSATNA